MSTAIPTTRPTQHGQFDRRRRILGAAVAALFASGAHAGVSDGILQGLYVPQRGWAETLEVARPELGELLVQLGTFRIVLIRQGWDELPQQDRERIRKRLVIRGTLHGHMDPETFKMSHTLANDERNGTLYTDDDVLAPESGSLECADGVPLVGTEILRLSSGKGIYDGLVSGAIHVYGVVNRCPGQAEFLQNSFDVMPGYGGLAFGGED